MCMGEGGSLSSKNSKGGEKVKISLTGEGGPLSSKKQKRGKKQTVEAAGTGCTTSGTPATATLKIKKSNGNL